jgi:hypothetical protein
MKLIRQCFYSTCLCVLALPAYSQQMLWYSGDTTAPSTYSSGNQFEIAPGYALYQDFVIPASVPGWHITGIFSRSYFPPGPLPTLGYWEIHTGMSAGNAGTLVEYGGLGITPAATGKSAPSGSETLTEYQIQLDGLSLSLPPGHYWLSVSPQDSGSAPLASQTSGANCVGMPCGSGGNPFREVFGLPIQVSAIPGNVDFSMGVIGTVAQSPVPPVLCQANSGTPTVDRAEGITELVGDILLNCSGGTPTPAGQAIPTGSFEVSLNTTITSRLLDQSTGLSEALLMIDDPNPGSASVPGSAVPPLNSPPQIICASPTGCAETGTGGSPSPYQTQPNVFLGQVSGSTIIWNNVPIDPPGPNATRTIRITNVRANASQLPLSTTLIPTAITATVSAPVLNVVQPQVTAGLLQPGLLSSSPTGAPISQCTSHNASLIDGSGPPSFDFLLSVSEGFASAFRRRDIGLTSNFFPPTPPTLFAQNVPGYPYNTETDIFAPTLFSDNPSPGLADFGTRILITFTNLPAGVHLFLPISFGLAADGGLSASMPPQPPPPVPAGLALALFQMIQADQFGNSPTPGYAMVSPTVRGGTVAEMSYSGTRAYATYEVLNSDPSVLESAAIPVAVAFNTLGANPGVEQVAVNINEAPAGGPLAGIETPDITAPIPRFLNNSTATGAFSVLACTVPITVTTDPPGVLVTVDGVTAPSPQNFNWTPLSNHTISAASPQGNSTSQYIWENGAPGPTPLTVTPTEALTFTGNFVHQYWLTTSGGAGGAISPQTGWVSAGSVIPITAIPANGFVFTGFSGDLSGTTTPQNLAMNAPHNVTANFAPLGSSTGAASFIKVDTTTEGNWQGVYGTDGYVVIGDLTSNPSYVTPVASGEGQAVWPNSPTDIRALQKASNPASRIAGVWYSFSSFSVDLSVTDGNTHQVALYCLDWDRLGRSETVAITDANGNVLSSQSVTNFGGGVYLVWNVSGHVKIQVTLTGGVNAVATGLFFGGAGTVVSSTGTAAFVKQDSTTQGNWQGAYGADGYLVIGDLTSNPSYVTPVASGEGQAVWPNSPTDIRALQMASDPASRIAGVWYSFSSFSVDLNIADSNTHQVALYCLDWDRLGRSETVAIKDANGNVLTSQSVTDFGGGVYLVWNVSGHVKIQVTLTGGANAVATGLFFGGGGTVVASTGTAAFVKRDSTTQGSWQGVYGTDGYVVIGDLTSNPSYVTPIASGEGLAVWPNSPTDVRALQKASDPAERIAGVWYSSTSFSVDLNITDSNTHQVALYCLDWDRLGRSETVAITDANGNVLSSQSVTNFGGGVYLVWNVSGHVKIQVTLTDGVNAVVTGLFFH